IIPSSHAWWPAEVANASWNLPPKTASITQGPNRSLVRPFFMPLSTEVPRRAPRAPVGPQLRFAIYGPGYPTGCPGPLYHDVMKITPTPHGHRRMHERRVTVEDIRNVLNGRPPMHPRCVLRGLRVQRGPSEPSPKGTSDGPHPAYPLAPPPGRGYDGAFLPHRRALPSPQPPWRSTLRVHKTAFGLRDHHPHPLAAAAGRGERTLVLAGCPAVLLPPVPGGSGVAPFLLQPAQGLQQAQALP